MVSFSIEKSLSAFLGAFVECYFRECKSASDRIVFYCDLDHVSKIIFNARYNSKFYC